MSTQHDSEGFMSTPLEGEGAHAKINIIRTARKTKFDYARQTTSINDSKKILLEVLEIDARDITLEAIRLRVLHHEEDSLRDVQRTCLSLK